MRRSETARNSETSRYLRIKLLRSDQGSRWLYLRVPLLFAESCGCEWLMRWSDGLGRVGPIT